MAKNRALAAKLVTGGHVRVNARKTDNPAKFLSIGDVLTVSRQRDVKVLRVAAFAQRRGPYEEARLLYEDLDEDLVLPAGDLRPEDENA
jgi:ribosome-associated heat shock protein Hsp15